jgi:hypothetical protein
MLCVFGSLTPFPHPPTHPSTHPPTHMHRRCSRPPQEGEQRLREALDVARREAMGAESASRAAIRERERFEAEVGALGGVEGWGPEKYLGRKGEAGPQCGCHGGSRAPLQKHACTVGCAQAVSARASAQQLTEGAAGLAAALRSRLLMLASVSGTSAPAKCGSSARSEGGATTATYVERLSSRLGHESDSDSDGSEAGSSGDGPAGWASRAGGRQRHPPEVLVLDGAGAGGPAGETPSGSLASLESAAGRLVAWAEAQAHAAAVAEARCREAEAAMDALGAEAQTTGSLMRCAREGASKHCRAARGFCHVAVA